MNYLICLHLTVHTGSCACKDNLTHSEYTPNQSQSLIGQLMFQLYSSASQWNEVNLHKSKTQYPNAPKVYVSTDTFKTRSVCIHVPLRLRDCVWRLELPVWESKSEKQNSWTHINKQRPIPFCVCVWVWEIFLALFEITWLEAVERCVFERLGKTETKKYWSVCHVTLPLHRQ